MKLFFASHNLDKKKEIEYILKGNFEVLYINDFDDYPEVEETGKTLAENALLKAKEGFIHTQLISFADDTGLEVDAINNAPGIYTARYAGENATYKDNYIKLLKELYGVPFEKRNARFITSIALFIDNDEYYFFEGICNGHIAMEPSGDSGFGYDPVFIPNGYNKTFAELSSDIKNTISHRALALKKFIDFINIKFNGA